MRAMMMTAAALALGIASAGRAQDMKTFTSAADVQAMIAHAKATVKPGPPGPPDHILSLAPYNANLEYRIGRGPAAVHEKEAEVFYVLDGSGTFVSGGKLTGGSRTNPTNLTGDGIEGGVTRKLAKGDFMIVPENTPHQVTGVDNGALILMTLHVPRG